MGTNSLLIVPSGFDPFDGLRQLQHLGPDPHPRHHAHDTGRTGFRRFGLVQRSGQLPRNAERRHHQPERRFEHLRHRIGQPGSGNADDQRHGFRHERRQPILRGRQPQLRRRNDRQLRCRDIHADRRHKPGRYDTDAICGANAGSSGTYKLSAGQLNFDGTVVGLSGTGILTQSGGTNSTGVGGGVWIGSNSGSSGAYNLNGSGLLSAFGEFVGYSGAGTFAQSGGTNSVGYWVLNIGTSGGSGTYNLSGTGLVSAGLQHIPRLLRRRNIQPDWRNHVDWAAPGITGGSYDLFLGYNAVGSGIYNLGGAGLLIDQFPEYVGYSGTGNFTQSGGTNAAYPGILLASNSGSNGTYNLNGGLLILGSRSRFLRERHLTRAVERFGPALVFHDSSHDAHRQQRRERPSIPPAMRDALRFAFRPRQPDQGG